MLVILILTIVIFLLVLGTLMWVRTPRYRIERHNAITLLEMVLTGQATENDWQVFTAVPLRHDAELNTIRERCMEIEEQEYMANNPPFLFSQKGLSELRNVLLELKNLESGVDH